jgi:hypothetical protein
VNGASAPTESDFRAVIQEKARTLTGYLTTNFAASWDGCTFHAFHNHERATEAATADRIKR